MIIGGELSAKFKARKKFECSEFVKGCNVLSDYAGHRVKYVNSNAEYKESSSITLESRDAKKTIEIDLQKDRDGIIESVLVMVFGEDINEDYLMNAVTLCKSAFKIDEVFI